MVDRSIDANQCMTTRSGVKYKEAEGSEMSKEGEAMANLMKLIAAQTEAMTKLAEASVRPVLAPVPVPAPRELPKLAKLTESDDVEAFMLTFERMMAAYEVEERRWAYIVAPQLMGKVQKAYVALEETKAGDYWALKEAILLRYDINAETYRQR